MTTEQHEEHKQHTFDYFCKRSLKYEAYNAYREIRRRQERQVNFSELRPEDMEQLAHAMRLLQLDYLGGHGSRGSGRVSLSGCSFEQVESDFPQEQLKAIFDKVDQYELLPV